MQVLDDGLDHDVAWLHVCGFADGLDAIDCRDRFIPGDGAFLRRAHEHLAHEIARLLGGAGARVGNQDMHAARRGDLHDAPAHSAGADHADDEVGAACVKCHDLYPAGGLVAAAVFSGP
ncbi:hypothetical protein D3C83_21510 [compost metagenome]